MAASTWWPTPTAPSKWFSAEQIANSRAYHRPPSTMRLVAAVVAIGFALAVTSLASGAGALAVWILTPLAALVPLLGYNWWYHDRHRPAFGVPRRSISEIFISSLAAIAVAFAAINAFVVIVREAGVDLSSLVLVVAIALALVMVAPMVIDRSRLQAISPEAATPFSAIAEWAQVRCSFRVDESSVEVNARAARIKGKKTVVLSAGLLEQPADLQSLVVAHEVAHLKLGHPSKLRLINAAHAGSVAVIGWLVASALGESVSDNDVYPLLAVGLIALWYLLTPIKAFVQRHFERQADAAGYDLLGSVSTHLGRQLHARTFSNLEPSLWHKLFSRHPPPAERLELISRRIPTL